MIDKEGADKHPYDKGHEASEADELQITRVQDVHVEEIDDCDHENDLGALPHHLLEWMLERLMKSEPRPIIHFSLVWRVDSRALRPHLDQDDADEYEALATQVGHGIRVRDASFAALFIGVRLLVRVGLLLLVLGLQLHVRLVFYLWSWRQASLLEPSCSGGIALMRPSQREGLHWVQ